MKLSLELISDVVSRGGSLAGRVIVLDGGRARELLLTLTFTERTRDYRVTPIHTCTTLHGGDLVTGQIVDFAVPIPPDGPASVTCANSALVWELELRADAPGLDTVLTRAVTIT